MKRRPGGQFLPPAYVRPPLFCDENGEWLPDTPNDPPFIPRERKPTGVPRAEQCAVRHCGKRRRSRGLCPGHYERWRVGGSLDGSQLRPRGPGGKICILDGCDRPSNFVSGLCKSDGGRFRVFGLTMERYHEIHAAQHGMCAGCAAPLSDGFHIDHDHSCCPKLKGMCGTCIRGFLCRQCNHALGMARDDPATLRQLADYIDQWRARAR